ncbi:MAG: hypothetical protein GXO80_02100 [Chlorobi bacterium]|nr:hypothetical protein [Chlorobiota bacterium]
MWFEKLTGFREESPEQVRANIEINGNKLISKINQKEYTFGKLEIPTLEELRRQLNIEKYNSKIQVSEIVGDVQTLHEEIENNGAFFQVASQFNLLEMIGPHVTPEHGIDRYEHDFTQGPACAIACGAGTIYRNYFVPVNDKTGQTINNQIDCLEFIGKELRNDEFLLWKMRNGYCLPDREGLININNQLNNMDISEREYLKGKLKIGLQSDTQVTLNTSDNKVTQAYCSALPVAYSNFESELWENFARLILEATYETAFFGALKNFERTGKNKVFLTLVGGGAFGNKTKWIFDAIKSSFKKFSKTPLDIKIISYGSSNPEVVRFLAGSFY